MSARPAYARRSALLVTGVATVVTGVLAWMPLTAQTPPPPAQGQVAGVAPGVVLEAPHNHTAELIPGVIAAGETVELLSPNVQSGDGIIGLPDGSAVFIELRDANYPGCTYALSYNPANDQLVGIYFQAAMQQEFEVIFERLR